MPAPPHEVQMLMRQIDNALRMGDVAAAGAQAERALAMGVEHPGVLNLAAHNAIGRGDLAGAIALLERARTRAPRDVHVLNSLGLAYKRTGEMEKAEAVLDAATTADARYANAWFNKGTVLEAKGALGEAEAAYARAIALEANFAEALGRLSYLAGIAGDYPRALAYADRALGGEPRAEAALNLAQFAILRGHNTQALALARTGLARGPGDPTARLVLARAEIAAHEGDPRATLAPILAGEGRPGDTHALALSLLARIEEEAGNHHAAFAADVAANAEIAANHAAEYVTPAGTVYGERVARTLAYFTPARTREWAARHDDGAEQPVTTHVFLVGFPRSGTSLLENALAAHPEIVTLEEEASLAEVMTDFFIPHDGFERFAALAPAALAGYRARYWRECREIAPALAGKVLVDKMPLNTVLLPFIARLFPRAKIVFALRDPRDVVLSCLKQQFTLTAAMYEFCTLEGSARLYDSVMQLREIYRAHLGLDWLDTRYKDLVVDYEATMRRIFAFLGVEWDERVRDVTAGARSRVIRTPSASQVAKGLYDGSGKWRRYKDEMAAVLPMLQPWAEKFGYPRD